MTKTLFILAACIVFSFSACTDPGSVQNQTKVADPTVSFDSLNSPSTVTITSSTTGASIYYTTDGSSPSPTSFMTTTKYTGSFQLYRKANLKAIATKSGLEDSGIVARALAIIPVTLSVGTSHSFNGINLRLDSIHWYSYKDFSNVLHTTNQIVLQFAVRNDSGNAVSTNPIYSWGIVLESPGNNQLNGLYDSAMYTDNISSFEGYSIADTANVTDACLFDAASAGSTSFTFQGSAPYMNASMKDVAYYFEVPFARSSIASVAVQ